MLEVRLLGKFAVRRDGKLITFASRPAQSLFAYLILNAGTTHRREKVAGLLWPDSLEETARDNLRHALWRMRKALDASSSTRFLHADDVNIGFKESSDYWLDAAELEKMHQSASADQLMAILSSYEGELLPGFYDEWVISEREHLNSIFEHQMARLMSLLQEEKRWLDILDWGERWIKLGQKPEPAYRALMSAHAAKGDMSKVAATYERCVKSLKEFGIEPSEQTKALFEKLKSGKEASNVFSASTKPVTKESSSNIPVPLTSFVGRTKEVQDVVQLVMKHRLVTLTGPGGVGKTRLAIETGKKLFSKFKDGVFWVGLAGLSDGNLIPQEIAESLNVRELADEPLIETLKTYLKSKDILLIMDNCEHLIKACAQHIEQLLVACPKLKILATSIEALGLFNEITWQVPSLPLPEISDLSLDDLKEFASIELFNERASGAKSSFSLDERNAFSVAQICRRLDGIPLAIELAAARIKILSVDEIAARLDDRFSLLTAGSRTATPRHQTLRATIDWSYDLLTEPEKNLFRRLSVFVGGFTLQAVESVCSQGMKRTDILDLLGRLVDKSLVVAEQTTETRQTRYRLLETLRQYALEKLVESGEATSLRDQHLNFFLDLVEESEPHTYARDSALWHSRLALDFENVRAALDWAASSRQANAVLRMAGSLAQYWFTHGRPTSEWYRRVEDALSSPEGMAHTSARAKALNGIGFTYWGDMDPVDQRQRLEEALAIAQEIGDQWNTATALRNLGLILEEHGEYEEARSYLAQSLKMWQEIGDEFETGQIQTFLGAAAMDQGEDEQASSHFEQSAVILKKLGNTNVLALALRRLGQLAWHAADYEKAKTLCKESLLLNYETDDPRGVLACIAGFANIALGQGELERAARLMGAVETLLASFGLRLIYLDRLDYERNLELLKRTLDEKSFAQFWSKGSALSFEEAITFAVEEA